MKVETAELLKSLEEIRKKHGEEAYLLARRSFARALILDPKGEVFLRENFPDLDLDAIRIEAQTNKGLHGDDQTLMALLRLYVPSLSTQFHYDTILTAFSAMAQVFDGYFRGSFEQADRAREALNKLFDMSRDSYGMVEKIREIPEQERGESAVPFVNPPKEFKELDEQRRLLAELDAVENAQALNSWYAANRSRIESVVTQKYRNELFDAIREKKTTISN